MVLAEENANSYTGESQRAGDGGVYLVVVDNSDEFPVALRYAARMARNNRGHLAILQTIVVEDFQHWSNIEERMRQELREAAEKTVWNIAKQVNDLNGVIPAIYIEEGSIQDVLVDVINRDYAIEMLVLAGSTGGSGPGPLVTFFSGKGLAKLRIPVAVVPGNLQTDEIDALT